jgi:hypothetical protein
LAGRLSSADVRFEFRRELSSLQKVLRKLTHLMGLLAGDYPEIAKYEGEQAGPDAGQSQQLLAPFQFGIRERMLVADAEREQINTSEAADIKARREHYAAEKGKTTGAEKGNDGAAVGEGMNAVGLSISGGGIRSATFALGVVQQLRARG